jgi:hypothetical protein
MLPKSPLLAVLALSLERGKKKINRRDTEPTEKSEHGEVW